MIEFRYFPFLGFKTLDSEEKELFNIPQDLGCKALVFEWMSIFFIIFGKVYQLQKKDDNGN